MNVRRLAVLRSYLRAYVPPTQFQLREWFGNDRAEDLEEPCGFVGCAVGHACNIREFQQAGLRRSGGVGDMQGAPEFVDGDHIHHGWGAAQEFFGLPGQLETEYLFGHWRYETGEKTTPGQVADRIDDVLFAGFPTDLSPYF
jgi:hypothetical protein